MPTLEIAHQLFYRALNELFAGDSTHVEAMWEESEEALHYGAFSEKCEGINAIRAEYRREALMNLGGKVFCKDVRFVEVGDIGYTTGQEFCEGLRGPNRATISFSVRVTNIYRRGQSGWRVIHHHTDKYEGCGQLGTPICSLRCMEPSSSCHAKNKLTEF
jgi:ketosteroid isomerase-like protein